MSDKTNISWTHATWNPVTGCSKVSAGCKNCYAERDWARLGHLPTYKGRAFTDVACHPERLDQPLRWRRPRRIFVNSMSDLFHPAVPDEFIDQVFAVMSMAGHHTFQVLTKRRMRDYFLGGARERITFAVGRHIGVRGVDIRWPLPNVWLGVSVENQDAADERIPLLLQTPAAVRWVSAEPLLGPVTLWSDWLLEHRAITKPSLDWLVVGGESGPKARGMDPEWARSLRDQCAAAGVPFHFKQWGAGRSLGSGLDGAPLKDAGYDFSERNGGRVLDGVVHDAYPEDSHD